MGGENISGTPVEVQPSVKAEVEQTHSRRPYRVPRVGFAPATAPRQQEKYAGPNDWMNDGSCMGMDSDLFFPERGDNETARLAKAVCATCVVRPQCREYAFENGEKSGVWGGMSERDRRAERRRTIGLVAVRND